MKCPVCQEEMEIVRLGSGAVDVDHCASCDGSWFDAGELDSLDDSTWTDVEHDPRFEPRDDIERRLDCPRCDAHMEPVSASEMPSLVLDRCPACEGFWLDNGELEQVRELSLELDGERLEEVARPDGWSSLRWSIYRLSRVFGSINP